MKKYLSTFLTCLVLSACSDDPVKKCAELFTTHKSEALPFCEQAANQGHADSQLKAGTLLLENGQAKQAVDFLEKSANQKNGAALVLLGEVYENGTLGEKDAEKAALYYKKSCDLDDIKGCDHSISFNKKLKAEAEEKRKAEKEREEARLAEEKREWEEREKEEQRLAEERKLAEERRAFEEEKAKEEKRLAEERKKLESQKKAAPAPSKAPIISPVQSFVGSHTPAVGTVDVSGLKFFDGLAVFQENGWYGFVNSRGQVVIPAQFRYAGRFSRQRSAVQANNGLWGFIDIRGNYVISPIYCSVAAFSETEGLAGVYQGGYKSGDKCVGGKWGFMDVNGNWAITPVLDHAERFINGKAKVSYQGRTGYINRYGNWVN